MPARRKPVKSRLEVPMNETSAEAARLAVRLPLQRFPDLTVRKSAQRFAGAQCTSMHQRGHPGRRRRELGNLWQGPLTHAARNLIGAASADRSNPGGILIHVGHDATFGRPAPRCREWIPRISHHPSIRSGKGAENYSQETSAHPHPAILSAAGPRSIGRSPAHLPRDRSKAAVEECRG